MATLMTGGRKAKLERMMDARRRWEAHASIREEGLARIKKHGIGAADTLKRQAEYAAREAAKATIGRGLRFGERRIGAWNPVEHAPSVQADAAARPVARIVALPGGDREPVGIATGFLIGNDLMMTNHHVFAGRADVRGHAANFYYAKDERGTNRGKHFEFDPDRFFVSDEQLDFAILAVKPRSIEGDLLSACGCTRLIEATGKVLTGFAVNIIQHPNGGPRAFAVSDNRLLEILSEGFLHYEADTAEGSSGSPVFNMNWELVGLHHSGVPAMKDGEICHVNGGVWDRHQHADDEIEWIANEGTRVSFIVDRLRQLSVSVPEQALLAQLLSTTTDPVAVTESLPAASPQLAMPTTHVPMAPISFHFSGPVTINVTAPFAPPSSAIIPAPAPAPGDAGAAGRGPAVIVRGEFEEKALVFDLDYQARRGYDPRFLGLEVPPPTVSGPLAADLYTVADYRQYFSDYEDIPRLDVSALGETDPLELKYHHFSLVQHKKHRMCAWTASNYDYRAASRQDARKRSAFGGESWREDPRVPIEFQLVDRNIYGPAKRIDRGHVVRREDNCWGEPGLATEYANSDTYHWTNCTPQHEAFNQENPNDRSGQRVYAHGEVGRWGLFERLLQEQIELAGGKAVLFAGPVLTEFFEAEDWGTGTVKIPKRFWKVVVVRESKKKGAGLLAYGYVFNQSNVVKKYGTTYEAIDLPDFAKQRESIADISALTGIRFSQAVLDAREP